MSAWAWLGPQHVGLESYSPFCIKYYEHYVVCPFSKYTINRRKERKEHRKQRRLEAKREKEYQENIKVIEDQQKATQKEEEGKILL